MLTAWRILDAIYDNPLAFIKDLMQEIRAVPEFREEECEKMMEYYMLLQSHIPEADKADVGAMLLIPANIADMTRTLPYAEGKRWRDQLGRIHPLDIGNGFSTFVDQRLEYATTQVANCERLVLPKPIPLGARANRSPSTDRHGSRGDRGGSVSRGNSASRGARVMGISAERKPAGEKKVRFPPPRKFDPDGPWRFPCVAGDGCQERHSPTKCKVFKKMTPRQRLEKVEEKRLCKLCFRHLAINECWAKGKTPNCQIKGCGGEHNYLLHDALMLGRALVVQEMGGDSGQSYSCREDIRAEVAGKTHRLHTLHDWGATLTLITHDAADRAGLTPIRHSARLVSGLGGKCLESTCFYVVPFVDGCDEIQTLRATGVTQISSLGASAPPSDIEGRFLLARGWAARLARPAEDADLLIGLDNQRWMPRHVSSSLMEGDNLRLMQSVLGPTCMLMGRAAVTAPAEANQGSRDAPEASARRTREAPARTGPDRQGEWRVRRPAGPGMPEEDDGNGGAADGGNDADHSIQGVRLQQRERAHRADFASGPGAMRQHAEGPRHRERSSRRDCADQEGEAGASHQVYRGPDNHDDVLRIPEGIRSTQIREVPDAPHDRAHRLQDLRQTGENQDQRQGASL
jgi:hypothetical protein